MKKRKQRFEALTPSESFRSEFFYQRHKREVKLGIAEEMARLRARAHWRVNADATIPTKAKGRQ